MPRKLIAWLVVFSMFVTDLIVPVAKADWISVNGAKDPRDRIASVLAREDVRVELARYGVSAAEVQARVAYLSDEEAQSTADRLDNMVAGGSDLGTVIGAILIVFFVLLFTDIIGVTKVYPFTRPMNR